MSSNDSTQPTILYVVHSLNPGGTERLAADMAITFSKEFNVLVAALDEPGRWAEWVRGHGVRVLGLYRQAGLDLAIPVKIARLVKREGVDLIHAHQTTPWFYSALSRYLWPRPRLLFEEHGRFYPEVYKFRRVLFNRFFITPRTHAVVAVSEDVGQRVARYEGVPSSAIRIIYNGKRVQSDSRQGDLERLRVSSRQALGFGEKDFLVGTVGRFDPIKNFPMFVKGVAAAHKEDPKVKGVIIGDGPVFAEVKRLIDRHGLEDVIKLTGFREDAARLILAFDLFALTSFSEGTSMALLEAMSQGVPSVVTRVGGNPEIVRDGHSGWIIPSDDPDSLTKKILDALRHPGELSRIGARAKEEFLERFTFERMIDEYRNAYKALLS